MKTEGLRQALDKWDSTRPSAAPAATRRRAGPRSAIFSLRNGGHGWDPRNQRPELWNLYNTRIAPGESMRVFPLSNWTELDIWKYIEAGRNSRSCRFISPRRGRWSARRRADHGRRRADAARAGRGAADCVACASGRSAATRSPAPSSPTPRRSPQIVAEMRTATSFRTPGAR